VGTLLTNLAQILRAYQLYGLGQTATLRLLEALRASFRVIWKEVQSLDLAITESTFTCEGQVVYRNDNRSESLAFLFYRDGIRALSFLPGFETDELAGFVEVAHRARYCRQEEDDLLTLLWQEDFSRARYAYVDAAADDAESDDRKSAIAEPPSAACSAGSLSAAASDGPAVAVDPEPLPPVSAGMLERASLPLDEEDVAYLQQEIAREMERDLEGDVLAALFDCFEDPKVDAQHEVVTVLQLFVPHLLARGQIVAAATALHEMRSLAANGASCKPPVCEALTRLLADVAAMTGSAEFLQTIAAMDELPAPESLLEFFEDLGSRGVEPLLRAAAGATRKDVESLFENLARQLVMRHPLALQDLLCSTEVSLARLAVKYVGLMGRTELAPATLPLLKHPDPDLRRMATEALGILGTPPALAGLAEALGDVAREVRLAAAWGLGTWQHQAALPVMKHIITAKSFRAASLSEKIGLLDAYARIAVEAAVPLLDELLNRRSLLKHREPSEVRACAAHALGLLQSPAAREPLAAAADDRDPAVRTAVARALSRMGEPS
jgi:HEAT repeat protein